MKITSKIVERQTEYYKQYGQQANTLFLNVKDYRQLMKELEQKDEVSSSIKKAQVFGLEIIVTDSRDFALAYLINEVEYGCEGFNLEEKRIRELDKKIGEAMKKFPKWKLPLNNWS